MRVHNETEQEFAELVNFNLDPTCEALDGCSYVAAWRVTLACCGFTLLLCNICLLDLVAAIEDYPTAVLKCRRCKTKSMYKDLISSSDRI